MKKILMLLVLFVTATMVSQIPPRYLYRSNGDPNIIPIGYNRSIYGIVTQLTGTGVNVNGYICNGTSTPQSSLLSNTIFPDAIFQNTSPSNANIKYAVIGTGSGGLNTISIAQQPNYLFCDFSSSYNNYLVVYRDSSNYWYWFETSAPSAFSTTPTVTSNGIPIALANNQFLNSSFSVYPNPTSSTLNIDLEHDFSASLYDLTGKKLLTFSTKTLDVSQLTSGIYVLDVIAEDKRYTKKIIKQ